MFAKVSLLICVLLPACAVWAGPAATSHAAWQRYLSADFGFSIDYPSDMDLRLPHPDYEAVQKEMVPVCEDTAEACFEYSGHAADGTNLQGAGVSVSVLRELRTEADCARIDGTPKETVTIGGIRFASGETGDAAMSHSKGATVFRTLHQGVCFEISEATSWVSMAPFEPGEIKSIDKNKLARISDEMDAMARSFRFVGPAVDGARWQSYFENQCGGRFEFPDGETVRADLDPVYNATDPARPNCSHSFTHDGLRYTLAAKDFKDENDIVAWLKASGYPAIEDARLVSAGAHWQMYRARFDTYILRRGLIFILSIRDAKERDVQPPDEDRSISTL